MVGNWALPSNPAIQADYDARDAYLNQTIGIQVQPLLTGEFPESLGEDVPTFSEAEKTDLILSLDCVLLDHYTTVLVSTTL